MPGKGFDKGRERWHLNPPSPPSSHISYFHPPTNPPNHPPTHTHRAPLSLSPTTQVLTVRETVKVGLSRGLAWWDTCLQFQFGSARVRHWEVVLHTCWSERSFWKQIVKVFHDFKTQSKISSGEEKFKTKECLIMPQCNLLSFLNDVCAKIW